MALGMAVADEDALGIWSEGALQLVDLSVALLLSKAFHLLDLDLDLLHLLLAELGNVLVLTVLFLDSKDELDAITLESLLDFIF